MLELDASESEPGYFIRLATSLAIIGKKPIKISNIRLNEENKGLSKSDVMYVKILAQLSNAKMKDLDRNKFSFTFEPGDLNTSGHIINLSFPALTPLFLPYIMLIFYNTDHKIRINGPTNREGKITIDYIKEVILPLLDKINVKQRIDITKRGYFQDIGTIILNTREQKHIRTLNLTELGDFERIEATLHSYGYGDSINGYMLEGADKRLRQEMMKVNRHKSHFIENREKYKGYGIDLYAQYENAKIGANYTSIRKQATQVGKEAADRLISAINKNLPLDKHSSNIILPFLALSKGTSNIAVAKKDNFTDIAAELCNKILGTEFRFEEKDNKTYIEVIPQ